MSALWNNRFMTGITILVMKYTITYGEYRVYCQYKQAHIECHEGHSIIINWAHYGRRNSTICGRSEATSCNDESAMETVIGKCSGRKECKLDVAHGPNGTFSTICAGVPLYAEIAFQCVRNADVHSICDLTQLTHSRGFLASPNYPENAWIGTTCTITISSTDGHRLNVTFKDIKMSSDCDQTSLTLKSGTKSKTICSNGIIGDTFMSGTDRTSIYLTAVKDAKFLLEYKAIKCRNSDIKLSDNMIIKTVKEYSHAVLGCSNGFTRDRANPGRLECWDNQWQGPRWECRAEDGTSDLNFTESFELTAGITVSSGKNGEYITNTPKTATHLVMYVAIGSCTGIVAMLILATGIFFGLKGMNRKPDRRDASTQHTRGPQPSTSIYSEAIELKELSSTNTPYQSLRIPDVGPRAINGRPLVQENLYQSLWTTPYGYNDAWSSRPGTCEKSVQTVDLDGINPVSVNVNVAHSPTVQEILARSPDSDSTQDSSSECSDEWESDPSDTSAPDLPPRSPLTYRETRDSISSGTVENEIYTSADAPDLIPQSL